jgi:uncharacterized protein YndB with AHSA1/START domain
MSDRIEKTIELMAPIERVWRAISDPKEFGTWFRVALDTPFVVGEEASGHILHPGFEHLIWRATVVAIEPTSRFAFTWHPYGVDKAIDYSKEEPTLVEFRLAPIPGGTRLIVTESGFDKIPAYRRDEAFRMNDRGWSAQVENIRAHVGA